MSKTTNAELERLLGIHGGFKQIPNKHCWIFKYCHEKIEPLLEMFNLEYPTIGIVQGDIDANAETIVSPHIEMITIVINKDVFRDYSVLRRTLCHELSHVIDMSIEIRDNGERYYEKCKQMHDQDSLSDFLHGKRWDSIFALMGHTSKYNHKKGCYEDRI